MDGPYDAPVSKVGQVSIPRPIRDALGLEPNSRVHFLIPDFLEGAALLVPDLTMHRWLRLGMGEAMKNIEATQRGVEDNDGNPTTI